MQMPTTKQNNNTTSQDMCHHRSGQQLLLSSNLKKSKDCKKKLGTLITATHDNNNGDVIKVPKKLSSPLSSVSFAPSEHNTINEIERIPEDLIEWIWYSEMELSVISSRNMDILIEMEMGIISECDKFTCRGLEMLGNGENKKRRQEVISKSINAVLNEQKRQQVETNGFISNPRLIASIYRSNGAKKCQQYAAAVGMQDYHIVTSSSNNNNMETKRTVLKATGERLKLLGIGFTGRKANNIKEL